MDQSLSVVLPVRNAEATLARQINQLLDILPDLTSRFEVLIVDDGSTDHTEESARELAREFPQLKVVRHAAPQGASGVVQTGLEQASGEVVFVQDSEIPISANSLKKLWTLHRDEGRTAKPAAIDAGILGRLIAWSTNQRPAARPTHVLRRAH